MKFDSRIDPLTPGRTRSKDLTQPNVLRFSRGAPPILTPRRRLQPPVKQPALSTAIDLFPGQGSLPRRSDRSVSRPTRLFQGFKRDAAKNFVAFG